MKNDERLIAALLSCPSVRAASEETGIAERTIYKRLRRAEFRERFDACRQEIITNACMSLQGRMNDAIQCITDTMNDERQPAAVRLRAAKCIIEYGLRAYEMTDILPRLEALEEAEKGRKGLIRV